jgi:hypothetical protein
MAYIDPFSLLVASEITNAAENAAGNAIQQSTQDLQRGISYLQTGTQAVGQGIIQEAQTVFAGLKNIFMDFGPFAIGLMIIAIGGLWVAFGSIEDLVEKIGVKL